ncbi:LUD domain-containing protein [Halolamina salifodinae]|uniref:Iron-sulfur cluster protein n=1 Tax=Halolamina salifodinae TaxID=1202767 RepID=A0A8T4GXP8_9EURY|nr:LUD domain-containing protein [Halolamina salifodinae]MBP1987759.1 iron-sulfur cluster protein [Halolamina salifodinae]
MSADNESRAERIRRLLETEGPTVKQNAQGFNEGRYAAMADVDGERLRTEAREIKEDAIERLPELIETVRECVEANGGTVSLADDAADANEHIAEVCGDADSLVKSKSMTTEELDVNEHLAARGIDVTETDLGEFVLQVADEAPSHLIAPGFHKSTDEIADLFNARFDPAEPLETPEGLTAFARDHLGERIRDADVGMTGANFVLAESGTLALVTNEGNARKCAVTPDTHVAVAGVEKLIPSVDELGPMIELLARSATGQDIAQYVSLLTPPTDSPTIDFDSEEPIGGGAEDREFHLVLVDNGRFEMREDEDLKETLYCVRCGACSNSCANFQHVGGHAFGGETYTGGIATGWEAGTGGEASDGTDAGSISPASVEFNDLCTGCSRCVNACPVKIDVPWINTVVRDRRNRGADPSGIESLADGLVPDSESAGMDWGKRAFGNIDTLARLGSATAPVSNWLADSAPARALLERGLGIDARRDLPEFRRETLRDWDQRRTPGVASPLTDREAVLVPDVFTNHVDVDRGKAAVRTLEALGVPVRVADVTGTGRAPFSQGMIATAREKAEAVADALAPHLNVTGTAGERFRLADGSEASVNAGRDLVFVEPSDLAMVRAEYDKLLPAEQAENLADGSFEVLEYVYGLLENGVDPAPLTRGDGEELTYHAHCQQRTLGLDAHTEAVLGRLGYDVATTEAECCGMAGSFGYKADYYDLSVAVGESLAAEVEAADGAGEGANDDTDRRVVASGTSCEEQLTDLLDRPATHPVELLDPARGPTSE